MATPDELIDAIRQDSVNAVSQILALNPALITEVKGENGTTLLHLAASYGSSNVIPLLLAAQLKLDSVDDDGQVPLHAAAGSGNVGAIRALIKAGANPSATDPVGLTPLHLAAEEGHEGAIDALLSAGADPNVRSTVATVPLHAASIFGRIAAVEMLIAANADITAAAADGATSIHLAAANGHSDVLELLLSCDAADTEARDDEGMTALLHAAAAGAFETLVLLIAAGADIHAATADGRGPLHFAASRGAARCVKALIAGGATSEINKGDSNGATALHAAAVGGDNETVALLLAAGASVTSTTRHGESALHVAAQYSVAPTAAVEFMEDDDLAASSDADIYNARKSSNAGSAGGSAVRTAHAAPTHPPPPPPASAPHGPMAKALSFSRSSRAGGGAPATNVHAFVVSGRSPTYPSSRSPTYASAMAAGGAADPHAGQLAALTSAAPGGGASHSDTASPQPAPEPDCVAARTTVVLQLIHAGTPLDLLDSHARTALHYAADCGGVDVVIILLEAGATPSTAALMGPTVDVDGCAARGTRAKPKDPSVARADGVTSAATSAPHSRRPSMVTVAPGDLPSSLQRSPLQLAERRGHAAVADILRKAASGEPLGVAARRLSFGYGGGGSATRGAPRAMLSDARRPSVVHSLVVKGGGSMVQSASSAGASTARSAASPTGAVLATNVVDDEV